MSDTPKDQPYEFQCSMDELQEITDSHFIRGQRAACLDIMRTCMKQLGIEDDISKEQLMLEREETILALRDLCDNFGDNDWEENLHLTDIINKHLGNHLYRSE